MNLSNEQFEVQQMKLELKSMKKQPVLAVEYSDMIRNTNVGWMDIFDLSPPAATIHNGVAPVIRIII
ncbi:hypothetical protein V6N11_040427 [Hibiscus sabdariffa]|uniref:Uncharacterized protein n=1 Tax=Hibiscus sabdariffa TaxID=183260 RepID=A0ABR2RHH1_9ROSI